MDWKKQTVKEFLEEFEAVHGFKDIPQVSVSMIFIPKLLVGVKVIRPQQDILWNEKSWKGLKALLVAIDNSICNPNLMLRKDIHYHKVLQKHNYK